MAEAEIDAYGFKHDRVYMLAQRDWTDKIDKKTDKDSASHSRINVLMYSLFARLL